MLAGDGCEAAFDSTVTELVEGPVGVKVSLTGVAYRLDFDLVIVADGIHSTTRDLVLDGRPVEVVDTKWGGWVVWAPEDANTDLGEELWGAGFFAGMYPVAGELGVFLGGPRADTAAGPASFVAGIRRRLTSVNPRLDSAMTAVADDPDAEPPVTRRIAARRSGPPNTRCCSATLRPDSADRGGRRGHGDGIRVGTQPDAAARGPGAAR